MAARAHAKFGGRDQATARGEGAAFGADEAIIDAVGEARIGTPYRFDHFGLAHIVGLAANERRHAAARRSGIERGWRERHMLNIMGTNMSSKHPGVGTAVGRDRGWPNL